MKRRTVGGRFTRREERIIEESDLDEDLNLKEELRETDEELAKDPSFLGHAERLTARARAFLRDGGLPDCFAVSFTHSAPEEWEEHKDLDLVVRPPRYWFPIDLYLRLCRDVRDDSLADLAARIVRTAYHLRRAVNEDARMWLAFDLGELSALFNVYSQVGSEHQNLNERRWTEEKEAKAMVLRDWGKEPRRFGSAAKAGVYYSGWLAKQGHLLEPRTVTDWIRAAKKDARHK